jgi:hypothetical protein
MKGDNMNQGFPPPGQPVPQQQGYAPAPGQPAYGYAGQQPVYVMQQPERNGLALAAMILGIIGVVVGLIPLFFLGAWICGVLAFIFGLVGRGKQKHVRRKMAWSGVILGVVAVSLGIVGVVIVNNAVNDVGDCLEAVGNDLDNGTNTSDAACD